MSRRKLRPEPGQPHAGERIPGRALWAACETSRPKPRPRDLEDGHPMSKRRPAQTDAQRERVRRFLAGLPPIVEGPEADGCPAVVRFNTAIKSRKPEVGIGFLPRDPVEDALRLERDRRELGQDLGAIGAARRR